jgi:hypothetical protein
LTAPANGRRAIVPDMLAIEVSAGINAFIVSALRLQLGPRRSWRSALDSR